ncbi:MULTISPECIES: 2-hydroxyacid dehydrogenase [unclassified Thalassospira]|uniref:2-hydroxyacid dehydrogenase n=1 Tax=unclassified Thalassospira TaxID=2648997 RepID=UPI0025F278EB|nr:MULTISPECIES: 2-hydroxyacid dehydrogenase [unclassified Thalassospira]|tara:strand:- start:953 stop:1891 length:939 start_codon:yes stop_codon:yes gene_type:complete
MIRSVLALLDIRPAYTRLMAERHDFHRYDLLDDKQAFLDEMGAQIRAVVTSARFGVPADLLAQLPNLEVITSFGVGHDVFDLKALRDRGIRVSTTPDILTDDVADTAIMLMHATMRRLIAGDNWVRSGMWAANGPMVLTRTVRGKKLGIVGLGRIGQAIASRAVPSGLEVGYFGRSKKDVDYRFFDQLGALAEWSDILVLACPGGAATNGIVDQLVLDALGKDGVIINIARGSVIDEPALIRALQRRLIAGAGLDVFEGEPNIDPAFSKLDNVVLYPHLASGTVETRDAMAQLVVDNLNAWDERGELITPII